ncbi:MAG: hypothetical protein ABJA70_10055, partial [Chryseolinea sp.]
MESSLTRSAEGTSDSLWQSIVLGMLQKMNRGKMVITLPSGYAVHIGDGMDPYHAEMTIRDMDFFKRCVMYGDIGFGETYVDGLWDTPNITKVISWFLFNVDKAPTISGNAINDWAVNVLKFANRLSNIGKLNTKLGSKKNISDHYDLN